MDIKQLSEHIKAYSKSLGFDACGFCRADSVDGVNTKHVSEWLDNSYHADMSYMANHFEKRCNPTLLVNNAKSIISVALNYYPKQKQDSSAPQFAYYAYSKDYHDVMKEKLQQFFEYIKTLVPELEGRSFCDTAPILERYWAAKTGIGFIGKNSLLIMPRMGSYFFLGELILNIDLEYDTPLTLSCGNCTRCLDACPTKAIISPKVINSQKCISYQTIENKGEIDSDIINHLSGRFYGCDICQQVCPWNRYASPHSIPAFNPSEAFLNLSVENMDRMTQEEYQTVFKGSAVKRAKFEGLKRNLEAWKINKNTISSK